MRWSPQRGRTPPIWSSHIAAVVNEFAEGCPQADDITLLCLAYAGAVVAATGD